ncbi:MAG: class II glutamine amidotransferase [Myxococcota bacterium]
MANLFAMSFEGPQSPSFDLRCLHAGRRLPDGWGIGFYRGGESLAATVFKEPRPPVASIQSQLVSAWEHLSSPIFLLQIRSARWGGLSDANTQPFVRSWGRRQWIFGHSGSLDQRIEVGADALFEPIGSTDTEAIFCELMTRIARRGWRSLREVEPALFRGWLVELNAAGSITCAISDGTDLWLYGDKNRNHPLCVWEVLPPYDTIVFGDDDLKVDLTLRGSKAQKGVIVCSDPMETECDLPTAWRPLEAETLLVVRQGAIMAELGPPPKPSAKPAGGPAAAAAATASKPASPSAPASPAEPDEAASGPRTVTKPRPPARPRAAVARRLEIKHRTLYRYDKPVERSTHLLRLVPMHDRLQRLVSSNLSISVDGQWRDFDDVFGNRARRVVLATPYTELAIQAHSLVVALDTDPFDFRPLHARTQIPLNWFPWQRTMLAPYLVPPELPESQLIELFEYAMSFVIRNDYDLVDSLLDMNRSIYTDYAYKQGTTTIHTTPFEVYATRRGVCQDFTNLFICLARILGIPARYVCGYLYTGPKQVERRAMSEATHAWVQVYLPELGWKGFDPTNGVLTQTDHVRVAVGRSYGDATPTSGTIYVGGGRETLEVGVTVEEDG